MTSVGTAVLGGVLGAAGVVVLAPVAARLLSAREIVDVPNPRSSHDRPTVRGAGLVTGPVLAVVLFLGADQLTLSLALVALAATIIGGIEDVWGIPVPARLVAQALCGAGFLAATHDVGRSLSPLVAIGAVVFVVGYVNVFNFMDGINGISVASAALAGIAFIVLNQVESVHGLDQLGVGLVVIAFCFLPFNFPQARMFLGDSGSYSFGMAIACGSIAAWRLGAPLDAVVAPLLIYLVDTSTAVLRRLWRRERITEPHREHVYQRLVQRGASHGRSVMSVLACSAATTGLGLLSIDRSTPVRLACGAGCAVIALVYLRLPSLMVRTAAEPA